MKKIKNLTVKVNYTVGLGDLEVPNNVYKQMKHAAENGAEIDGTNPLYEDAAEWIKDNVRERDCMEHGAEIQDIS